MNGVGNKILTLDLRGTAVLPTPAEARAIHRAPGLDYDQLMVLSDPLRPGTEAFVRIYNNDGSEAGACGNGTRCVADRLARVSGARAFAVETAAGVIACERLDEWTYRVDMGRPRLGWNEIPLARPVDDERAVSLRLPGVPDYGQASVVNMGNPHAIFWVEDVAAIPLESVGPRFENPRCSPRRRTSPSLKFSRLTRSSCGCGSAASGSRSAAARPPARRWSPRRGSASPAARRASACRAAS